MTLNDLALGDGETLSCGAGQARTSENQLRQVSTADSLNVNKKVMSFPNFAKAISIKT